MAASAAPLPAAPPRRRIRPEAGRWALFALIAATSLALGMALNWWLVPFYLALMAWLLLAPGASGPDTTRAETGRLDDDAVEPAGAETEPEPGEGPRADLPEETPPKPAGTRRRKGKGRTKAKPTLSPEPPPATWVQVGPGKFVRVEGAEPAAPEEPAPEASEAVADSDVGSSVTEQAESASGPAIEAPTLAAEPEEEASESEPTSAPDLAPVSASEESMAPPAVERVATSEPEDDTGDSVESEDSTDEQPAPALEEVQEEARLDAPGELTDDEAETAGEAPADLEPEQAQEQEPEPQAVEEAAESVPESSPERAHPAWNATGGDADRGESESVDVYIQKLLGGPASSGPAGTPGMPGEAAREAIGGGSLSDADSGPAAEPVEPEPCEVSVEPEATPGLVEARAEAEADPDPDPSGAIPTLVGRPRARPRNRPSRTRDGCRPVRLPARAGRRDGRKAVATGRGFSRNGGWRGRPRRDFRRNPTRGPPSCFFHQWTLIRRAGCDGRDWL